ncbi:MAG: hypothetical protein C0432_03865 [Candidatus Puniceispirillum sp.]|nr:hypothetical protein [Candidatus Pelagibacter sp.]MBA4283412.1 hypothetical protein [Candidatus Puniceispirillum sp.]
MDIVSSLNQIKQQLLDLNWENKSSQGLAENTMTDEEFSHLEKKLNEILVSITNTSGEEREVLNQEVQAFYEEIKVRFEMIKEKLECLKNENDERVQYIKAVNAYGKN